MNLSAIQKLQIEIIAASPGIDIDLDFWKKGDVSVLTHDTLKIKLFEIRARAELEREPIESELDRKCWFAYRRLDAFERTLRFVQAHDAVLLRGIDLNAELSDWSRRQRKERGSYLSPAQLEHPFCICKNGRWQRLGSWSSYVEARRKADRYCFDYTDYIAAGMAAAAKRGWNMATGNAPSHLASQKLFMGNDNYRDATIAGILLKQHEAEPRRCHEPEFQPGAYVGGDLQRAYWRFFAKELLRIGRSEIMARQKWRLYLKAGLVPARLTFEDAISGAKSGETS